MQLYAENPERFAENLMNRKKTCALTPASQNLDWLTCRFGGKYAANIGDRYDTI
jgi:hypothetical protein